MPVIFAEIGVWIGRACKPKMRKRCISCGQYALCFEMGISSRLNRSICRKTHP